jgi:hypothetical protein
MPGHDLGHAPPVGLSWGTYLDHFVREHGGWTALSDELIHRASNSLDTPMDLQTVEKGLRRLAARENKTAGQYGRWMLRFFGVPPRIEEWARWLAQYHSRFADLPTSLRLSQLRLWDRPPISDSSVAAWIHVGLASVHHRMRDLETCRQELAQAERGAERSGPSAVIEVSLLRARLATDDGKRPEAEELFDRVEELLATESITREDRLCYRARLVGQRGYHLTKPLPGASARLEEALELFASLEEDATVPFACYRRNAGMAYCRWKLGDADEGARLARQAADDAGDGGYVRFRIMALNMLSQMVEAKEGARINERAARLAKQLEDEDLLERVYLRSKKIRTRD